MQDRSRLFTITCLAFTALATTLVILFWANTPPVQVHWSAVLWLVVFGTVTELLVVSTGATEDTLLTPSAAVHWAAPCIFGPVLGSLACAASALAGTFIMGSAFYLARALKANEAVVTNSAGTWNRVRFQVLNLVARIGSRTEGIPLRSRVESGMLYASTLVVGAGLSGYVYSELGGQYLAEAARDMHLLSEFLLPFLGLVVVSILVEHGEYIVGMAIVYPVQGARGWYGFVLRARLAFIEDVLPVWRGELFLVVVSLLMAFLYSHIGVMGLLLAFMPVLALRDFFGQWVKTKQAYLDTITTLATYMQHYHPYTRGHLKRVAEMSERLARELRLSAESIRHMNTAGFLHDIGKIAVSEEILDKTEKLTDDEWATIKEHPVKGAEIISHLEFLEGIVDWIKYHHKWYNGSGYPGNGNGHAVPIEAAIIATADAFDAMTDDRELTVEWRCDSCGYRPEGGERPRRCPECGAAKRRTYREPKSLDEAIDELRRGAGSQFDPRVVKAFLTMVEREGIHLNA